MQNLIDLTRQLIGDLDSVDRVFTDDDIRATLERYAERVNYLPLAGFLVRVGGAWEQREFRAAVGFWGDDAQFFDTQYQEITPKTSNFLAGRWLFESHQADVFLTGVTCDAYGAAADLLALWAGRSEYGNSQRGRALMDAAQEMRKRMRPRVVEND